MNKLNLIHTLIFANNDREEGHSFDIDFNKMWPYSVEFINKALSGLAGVDLYTDYSPENNGFKTSNKAVQEFNIELIMHEETSFSVAFSAVIYDAAGTKHTIVPFIVHERKIPLWMKGIQVKTSQEVKTVEVVREVIKEVPVEVIKEVEVVREVIKEVERIVEVEKNTSKPVYPQLAPVAQQTNLDIEDKLPQHIQELVDQITTEMDLIELDSQKLSTVLQLPATVIINVRNGIVDPDKGSVLKDLLNHVISVRKKLSSGIGIKTSAVETPDAGVSSIEQKEVKQYVEKNPTPKEALAEIYKGYVALLGYKNNLQIATKACISREVTDNITVGRLDNVTVSQFNDAIECLKKLWSKARVENAARVADREIRISVVNGIRDIILGTRFVNKSVKEICADLDIPACIYYAAKSLNLEGGSISRFKEVLETAQKNLQRIKDAEAKQVVDKATITAEKKEKERLDELANAPSAEGEEKKKLGEHIGSMINRNDYSVEEISKLLGISSVSAENIKSGLYEKFDVVDMAVMLEVLKDEEKRLAANPPKAVKSLKDIALIVNNDTTPDTKTESPEIPKYDKSYLKKAEEQLRAKYGPSYECQGGRINRELFESNRKKLYAISKNQIELSRMTGIPLNDINKSFNLGAKLPARNMVAISMYLLDVEIFNAMK